MQRDKEFIPPINSWLWFINLKLQPRCTRSRVLIQLNGHGQINIMWSQFN